MGATSERSRMIRMMPTMVRVARARSRKSLVSSRCRSALMAGKPATETVASVRVVLGFASLATVVMVLAATAGVKPEF